jgi:dihydrofolate reductase
MRKIVATVMVSLDGVMQAPGGPEEDPTGGFRFGGWVAPFWDEASGAAMGELFAEPYDLLLGRRTYDIFAAYWPFMENSDGPDSEIATTFNRVTKYVATHRPDSLTWVHSVSLGSDIVARLRELQKSDGPRLLIQGSSDLLHALETNGLIDELNLLVFPVVLGKGKRLFDGGARPVAMNLTGSKVLPSGVAILSYVPGGEVKTGSFGADNPSPAEIERRKSMKGS